MTEVIIENINYRRIYEILHDLQLFGLEVNQDYEFRHQPAWSRTEPSVVQRKMTIFSFENDSMASWFSLKYVK
jgi:hypothetical protein